MPAHHMPIDPTFKHLKGVKELPDVTLVVEKTGIPAHRQILSVKSDYFMAMFSRDFIEAKSDKIILKETNLKSFKRVLEYIYTGHTDYFSGRARIYYPFDQSDEVVRLNEIFDLLFCARYYLVDTLTSEMISYIKRASFNPRLLLNYSLAYSIDELISYSTYVNLQESYRFDTHIFDQMSPQSVEHCLKLHLRAPESEVFEALISWMRRNPNYSFSFSELLNHIDLNLLKEGHLDMLAQANFTFTNLNVLSSKQ
uniref:BTB domain-containing protein n=1 Tax=Panagrellus redivivus TaxID=6233 RepID=A0A7E4W9Z7_PANRE